PLPSPSHTPALSHIYPLSLHDALPISSLAVRFVLDWNYAAKENLFLEDELFEIPQYVRNGRDPVQIISSGPDSQIKTIHDNYLRDRKSTRLNSSHVSISYAVFCLKKKI